MMKLTLSSLLIACIFSSNLAKCQNETLIIQKNIHLPKDSLLQGQLLGSINGLLAQLDKENKDNSFVLAEDLLEMSLLLDEMKNLGKSEEFNEDHFYQPYLTSLLKLDSNQFIIQVSFLGVHSNSSFLRASFTVLGFKEHGRFYFRSPLKQNTMTWKMDWAGNTRIHFKKNFNKQSALAFFKMVADYDRKLNVVYKNSDFYCADNFYEALRLIGVDYKSDYNGEAFNSLTGNENKCELDVDGLISLNFNDFDPHDLWHDRLHRVLSSNLINRPVDEGTAYLYGGSWGISWQIILTKFRDYAKLHPNNDWLKNYNEKLNFNSSTKYPLRVDYAINALIAQKLEKEKGFPSVLELLSCGKEEEGNGNYFEALAKIAGISKSNFNSTVWFLINSSNP